MSTLRDLMVDALTATRKVGNELKNISNNQDSMDKVKESGRAFEQSLSDMLNQLANNISDAANNVTNSVQGMWDEAGQRIQNESNNYNTQPMGTGDNGETGLQGLGALGAPVVDEHCKGTMSMEESEVCTAENAVNLEKMDDNSDNKVNLDKSIENNISEINNIHVDLSKHDSEN